MSHHLPYFVCERLSDDKVPETTRDMYSIGVVVRTHLSVIVSMSTVGKRDLTFQEERFFCFR